jgi:wyosine [tRNA(Phe)-imidazoG37] synthetase (radical SAM superfamily)/biotin operon repressor
LCADKKVTGGRKYLYGPVPSRRLGLSYGVDIVPFKVCTLDCVYCQLGRTVEVTTERKDFAPIQAILTELRGAFAEGSEADFVTMGGSGEPTLHSRLGELIDGIKEITDIPVALLTNGTLLGRADVAADCAGLDVVLPSLDAGDEQTFRRIDRPDPTISIDSVISGLCTFREVFSGQIWLEVFIVPSINSGRPQIAHLKDAIDRIKPDKVQLNTAVRPTADPDVTKLDAEKLKDIAVRLGPACEVVADFSRVRSEQAAGGQGVSGLGPHFPAGKKSQALLSMLKRRPCSLDDISAGLDLSREEAMECVSELQDLGLIEAEHKGGRVFFKSVC